MAIRILTKLIEYLEWDINEDIKKDNFVEETFEDMDDIGKLFYFCHRNELEKFQQLVLSIHNFDVNIKNKDGHSLLHIVSCHGYIEFIQYLLTKYSQTINVNIMDSNNNNATHWASMSGHTKCLKLLIKNGANILNINRDSKSISKDGFFVVVRQMPVYSIGGRTCLHFAAENGNIECLYILINYVKQRDNGMIKDIINLKDFHGYTALDLAIMNKKKDVNKYTKCIKLLSEYVDDDNFIGVDLNYSLSKEQKFKQFVYDYYKSQERIAQNFKDTLPGMHGNCCDTCREMYHIADMTKK